MPSPVGESARYYLLSVEPDGKYLRSIHKRIGTSGTGYSSTRIDCKRQRFMDLGYSENSVNDIKRYDHREWAELVEGSSKWNLVQFVCARSLERGRQ